MAGIELQWALSGSEGVDSVIIQYSKKLTPAFLQQQARLYISAYPTMSIDQQIALLDSNRWQQWVTYSESFESTTTASTVLDYGLFEPNELYVFRVLAFTSTDYDVSNIVTHSSSDLQFTVTGFDIQVSTNRLSLSWTAPTSNGQSSLLGYLLYVGTDSFDGQWSSQQLLPGATTSIDVTCVTVDGAANCIAPYTRYTVAVTAVRADGVHGAPVSATVTTVGTVPSTTPDIIVGGTTTTSVSLQVAPIHNLNGAAITALVECSSVHGVTAKVVNLNQPYDSSQLHTINVTSLDPGVTYTCHMQLTTSYGSTNSSLAFMFSTQATSIMASSSDTVAIVAGTVIPLCLIIIIFIIVFAVLSRRRSKSLLVTSLAEQYVAPEVREALAKLRKGHFVIPREINATSINVLSELGAGKFGTVFKATLDERSINGVPAYIVAVKTLNGNCSAAQRTDFLLEAAIMAQFSHTNIVQLIGQVTQGEQMMLVQQFCEHGSLQHWLVANGKDSPVFILLNMAADVADGMAYMASHGFVHRDLAARNVLVGSDYECKVSDFGFARNTDENDAYVSQRNQLAVRWAAVESLQHHVFTSASDVWSFGILLHEMFTAGARPYDDWSNQRVWAAVVDGYRLEQQPACPDMIYTMMRRAWNEDAKMRPTFADISKQLRDISQVLNSASSGLISFSRLLSSPRSSFTTSDNNQTESSLGDNLLIINSFTARHEPELESMRDAHINSDITGSSDLVAISTDNPHDASKEKSSSQSLLQIPPNRRLSKSSSAKSLILSSRLSPIPSPRIMPPSPGSPYIDQNVDFDVTINSDPVAVQFSRQRSNSLTGPVHYELLKVVETKQALQANDQATSQQDLAASVLEASHPPEPAHKSFEESASTQKLSTSVHQDGHKSRNRSKTISFEKDVLKTRELHQAELTDEKQSRHQSKITGIPPRKSTIKSNETTNVAVLEAQRAILRRQNKVFREPLSEESVDLPSPTMKGVYVSLIGADGFEIDPDEDIKAPSTDNTPRPPSVQSSSMQHRLQPHSRTSPLVSPRHSSKGFDSRISMFYH